MTVDATSTRLLGRARELAQLAAIAGAAREGRGSALLIEGSAGVGKSALLGAVDTVGLRVLRAAGTDAAFAVPLAGIIELLTPLTHLTAGLPTGPGAALRAALEAGIAPPGTDEAVLMHASVQLLALAARQQRLLVCVDDVQWLDATSQEVVRFAARRADRIGAGFLLVRSLRGDRPGAWAELDTLPLGDLPRSAAIALARRAVASGAVAEQLVDALGGNPLALREAPEQLSAAQREGAQPLPEAIPTGRRILRAYESRLEALDDAARWALVVLAASARPQPGPVLAALGEGADAEIFAAAEQLGLVLTAPGEVRFAHPLVQRAVLELAGPARVRAAHAALAQATELPERALHAGAAALAPDEAVAAALEQLGYDALLRGAAASGIGLFARSAALSPQPATGRARTRMAAAVATMAGRPEQAASLLDPLLPQVADAAERADLQLLRGMAMQLTGRPTDAAVMLQREADAIEASDPARASALLTQAGVALAAEGPLARLASVAERAERLAPPDASVIAGVLRAEALACLGDHRQARALLRAQRAELLALDPTGPGHEVLALAGLTWLWMEDFDDADWLLGHLVETARARGAVGALAFPLAVQATLRLRQGDLRGADRLAQEAMDLSDHGVGGFVRALCLTAAGFTAGHLARLEESERYCAEAVAISERLALRSALASAEQGRGFAALSGGDVPAAITFLERARAHTERFGYVDPSFLYTHADLAEAYARAGDLEACRRIADDLAAKAAITGGRWARAATARCRALLAESGELDGLLDEALSAHAEVALPFELARTQLCFGERLRRVRRRSDARRLLQQARETFAAVGAEAWERRAAHELAASGATTRPAADHAPSLPAQLTAREQEVCELVASGASNAEAAAALFLSERTVEHHLRMAYRKLGVRSRTQLAALFS